MHSTPWMGVAIEVVIQQCQATQLSQSKPLRHSTLFASCLRAPPARPKTNWNVLPNHPLSKRFLLPASSEMLWEWMRNVMGMDAAANEDEA